MNQCCYNCKEWAGSVMEWDSINLCQRFKFLERGARSACDKWFVRKECVDWDSEFNSE